MANYPLPSTHVNVANFVSVRPWLKDDERRTRYSRWKEQMLCLLESQDLLGFIDGQIPAPSLPEQTEEEQKLWRRTDRLVKGWILGSIGDDAIDDVARLDSSREVWMKMEKIFNLIQHDNNHIKNQTSDSSENRGAEGDRENHIVELQSHQISNNVAQQNNGTRKLVTC